MELTVSVRTEYAVARLLGGPERMRRSLRTVVTRLSLEVQRSVKQEKLSGQVLHVRTGTLRRSINREVIERPDGVFAIVGTNVDYARTHEFGFIGVVNVREHARKTRTGAVTSVRMHTRHVELPERSFLRSTLMEYKPRIVRELRDATIGALK